MVTALMTVTVGGSSKQRDQVAIKAVHDEHLISYLRSLGFDPDAKRLAPCKFCGSDVTLENLAAIFPQSGAIKVVCDQADCLMEIQELLREGIIKL